MFIQNYLENHKRLVVKAVVIILSTVILSFIATIVQPFEYKTETELLIIYNPSKSNFDPYLALKTAERVGISLTEVIYTSSFIEKARNSGYKFPENFWEQDTKKLKKQWKHIVNVKIVPQTGFLNIETFAVDENVSKTIAYAVSDVLVTQGSEYHGAGEDIVIRVVDSPMTSNRPARPNLPLNLLAGFVIGCVLFAIVQFVHVDAAEKRVRKVFTPCPAVSKKYSLGDIMTGIPQRNAYPENYEMEKKSEHGKLNTDGSALIEIDPR